MTTPNGPGTEPLWLAIERGIQELGTQAFSNGDLESSIQKLAGSLDAAGLNVSTNAGSMLALRGAMAARAEVGRPLMEDLDKAFQALTLDDVEKPFVATVKLIDSVGADWPALKDSERRPQVQAIVERVRLDLLEAKAKELGGDLGIRYLMGEDLSSEVILERLGIGQDDYDRVLAEVEAEKAERARVVGLLDSVSEKPDADKIRHLVTSNVAEDLIVEIAEVDQPAIDEVKKAMEAEIAEKERLAAEAAARKAAEAAGPALDDIPPEEMLDHIEAIREILDFSDVEKEIRAMCEQSSIPKDLIEIAVSEPDRLDELEEKAESES
jgi:hypothetical protein